MPTAPPKSSTPTKSKSTAPAVLFVDDEPAMLELAGDILGREIKNFRLLRAASIAEAKRLIEREKNNLSLVLLDLQLPDGRGADLMSVIRAKAPAAGVVVISGQADVAESVQVFRNGAIDFIAKPFSAEQLVDRVKNALQHQHRVVRTERRLVRLKSAVRKLNSARHMVSKKVDVLCNDLIGAYGELARQFEDVRVGEDFRKTINASKDLEQMLCHAMDWMLRKSGYTNIAIYLASDDASFELGAYMKYTIPGSKSLTDALKLGIVEQAAQDQFVSYVEPEIADHLTAAELEHVHGNGVMAVNAAYLGESLGVIVMFRDGKTPFTQDDAAMLKSVAPLFAQSLTTLAKTGPLNGSADDAEEDPVDNVIDEPDDASDSLLDQLFNPDPEDKPKGNSNGESKNPKNKGKKKDDPADWWKRGDDSPY